MFSRSGPGKSAISIRWQSDAPRRGPRSSRTGHRLFCKTCGFTSAMTHGPLLETESSSSYIMAEAGSPTRSSPVMSTSPVMLRVTHSLCEQHPLFSQRCGEKEYAKGGKIVWRKVNPKKDSGNKPLRSGQKLYRHSNICRSLVRQVWPFLLEKVAKGPFISPAHC